MNAVKVQEDDINSGYTHTGHDVDFSVAIITRGETSLEVDTSIALNSISRRGTLAGRNNEVEQGEIPSDRNGECRVDIDSCSRADVDSSLRTKSKETGEGKTRNAL
jgi:hypothetical protein